MDKPHRHSKKHKRKERESKRERKHRRSSSSSESDKWVEKEVPENKSSQRDDWMSMTGMLKTYTKEDIKPKREDKDKKHIDSYNPSTSSRELNPYWKDGGTGLPQTAESFRKSRAFMKPVDDDDDYYTTKSSTSQAYKHSKDDKVKRYSKEYHNNTKSFDDKSKAFMKPDDDDDDYYTTKSSTSQGYKNSKDDKVKRYSKEYHNNTKSFDDKSSKSVSSYTAPKTETVEKVKDSRYLSDEKMNKLGAKIVKAEIMGDHKLVEELKSKLEAAREYRKQNPNVGKEDENEGVMLISTNSAGNSRPLSSAHGDPRSKGGKRKAETHESGNRVKYFGNDDRYNLAEMFQQEKYGNNYDDEAQLANVAGKLKNPNDDLEDIFMDEISKNRNVAKDSEKDKQRAINQHVKIEKALDGCEYCIDSKNMLKHLMVSCGTRVYVSLPAKKSLVEGQCLIATIQHSTCVTAIDEDVWEEILNYRKAITKMFNSQNKDVVFFETATRLHKYPHMVINCVPLPRDVGDMAAIYFKKALLECEAEWSMNKKVVDLKGKNIRKGIPKGLPYFWIDFGMDPGFAHVIEDQQLFPRHFAEEIIGGILDLDHNLWKNPRKEFGDQQRKKVLDFIKEWKSFDPAVKS